MGRETGVLKVEQRDSEIHGPKFLRRGLTEQQGRKWEAFVADPLNKKVIETMTKRGKLVLIGGSALMIASENVEVDRFLRGGLGEPVRVDSQMWGDSDWMVDDIEGLENELRDTLSGLANGKMEIKRSGDEEYPRIEILVNGMEVHSFSSLNRSANYVRHIRDLLGQKVEGDDLEVWLGGSRLANWKAIEVKEGGLGTEVLEFEGEQWPNLHLNKWSIQDWKTYSELKEKGYGKEATRVLEDVGGSVGKILLLSTYGISFGTHNGKMEEIIREEMKLLSKVRDDTKGLNKARQVLAERIVRALAVNLLYSRANIINLGVLQPFSPTLAKTLEDHWFDEDKWDERNRLTGLLGMSQKIAGELPLTSRGINGFLLLMGYGLKMKTKDFFKVVDEMKEGWRPRQMEGVSMWGGWRPVEVNLDAARVKRTWEKVNRGKGYTADLTGDDLLKSVEYWLRSN